MAACTSIQEKKCAHCDTEESDSFYPVYRQYPFAYCCEPCFKKENYRFQCESCKRFASSTLNYVQFLGIHVCIQCCVKSANKMPVDEKMKYPFETSSGVYFYLTKDKDRYGWSDVISCMMAIYRIAIGEDALDKRMEEIKKEYEAKAC